MVDRTAATVTIHACPPHRVRTVCNALESFRFGEEITTNKTVTLGESYDAVDVPCGIATELAHELSTNMPDVAFTVYEEPVYERLGTTCTYVPILGLFTADCDASGEPFFGQSQILQLETATGVVRQAELGLPWRTAVDAAPAETVSEPDRLTAYRIRSTSEVIVAKGKQGGGDLVFAVPRALEVDAALVDRGFQRADDWVQLDETGQLWHTPVYRCPAT